ncbi:MAG: amino acid adenylation domain-containing protein, partial [Caldithrix sp.]|nr:amino acid adenylation domain-containing protein [Caldithrix sp.]
MSNLEDRLKNLTPEQRELLLKKLKSQDHSNKSVERVRPREDKKWYPLSDAQKRLWFLNQMDPESPFYNIPSAIRIHGPIDERFLQQSIIGVLQRHEILRTSFPTDGNGEPTQIVNPVHTVTINKTDLTHLHLQEAEQEARKITKTHAAKIFHLEQYPLYDFHLIKLDENKHILSINMHHIIIDGWSLGVFINEFSMLYKALSESGKMPALDDPHLQYFDYVAWQIQRSTDERYEEQLKYWSDYLKGMPQFLELIPDKSRPAVQTYNGRHYVFSLSSDTTQRLRELAREQKASLYAVMMAAFQLFLHKISGQEDFGVGAPIANRHRAELENIIGYFVNTIVLRCDLSENITFPELVGNVQNDVAAASDHQDIPFERIVEKMVPDHEISHSPLFQVMFDLQKAPFDKLNLGDIRISIEDVQIEVAKFDLMMLMMEYHDYISVTLEYNTDLFYDDTIKRFADYFSTMLTNVLTDPHKNVRQISLLNADEKEHYLTQWNQTQRPYPAEKAINQIFEAVVDQHSDAIAMEFDDVTYDYETLNQKANQYARFLMEKGVQPDDTVALFMERIPEMFIAILGILKAGAVYVPLDTAYPFERVKFMLEDSGSKLLISQKEILSAMASLKIEAFTIETIAEQSASMDDANVPVQNNGQSRAYIIYTSGSTGTPKGVVVPHQAISRLIINTDYIELKQGSRIAQVSNATFDAATLEIWGAFLTGATLIGFEKDAILNMNSFGKALQHKKIDAIFLTSALFNQIALEMPDAFNGIKYLMTGGDKADPTSFRKVRQHSTPGHLINGYGPTENTTFSTTFEVKEISPEATNIPIGKPIANSYHYILDKNLQPVPIGVPGELYLGGDGLALGYHNRPKLNKERFIQDPFVKAGNNRLYKSGDLVRYLPTGDVEFLGRIDQQVKIRGFRVELGEIETRLKQHKDIKDCVVILKEDDPENKQLIAYYVPQNEALGQENIKRYLAEVLPDYMIPSIVMPLDQIPVTPNGKVDRRALPEPERTRSDRTEYVAPRNKLESYLAKIWQDILKVEQISVFDNFFELGGNSLQAAIFNNKLQKDFNVETHVAGLFKAPRIADFSAYVIEYYPDLVREQFGDQLINGYSVKIDGSRSKSIDKISDKDVHKFRNIINALPPQNGDTAKNPRAVFVLSPPRSGSTL